GGEAWIIVLAAGLATPLWVYGRVLFPEAVLALVLTAAVSVLASPPGPLSIRNGEGEQTGHESRQVLFPASGEGGKRHDVKSLSTCGEGCREGLRGEAFLAGLILGAGIAVRAALAIYVLPLIGLIVWGSGSWKNRIGHAIPRVVAFGIGTLPGVALVLWFNAQRFDDPLRFGYTGEGFTTPPWKGLIGLLVSPGRGIFVYAPPLILSVILWPRFRRTAPALAWFLAGSWAVALAFYGTWWAWHGGWCWGPRFLVPLLPLSCLPLGVLPPGRMWRLAAVLLIAAGIAVQIPGVRVDLTPLYIAAFEAEGSPTTTDSPAYDTLNFDPAQSLLAGAIRRLADGHTEPLALFHLRDSGLPPTWTTGAPLAVIVGLVIGVRGIIRRNGPGG
ncbi:MAG: hypothetical protein JXQ72_10285, partial [Anaerolineae bacterium]|nr:hypothetical protein [Anaerolineae bacterium]